MNSFNLFARRDEVSRDAASVREETAVTPSSASRPTFSPGENPQEKERNVFGEGLRIDGDVSSDTDIVIRGTVHGNIVCRGDIELSGSVQGDIEGRNVRIVGGRIEGNVVCSETLKVERSSVVGNLTAQRAQIDNKVEDPNLEKQGRKLLDMAAQAAASADNYMQQLLRYDVNIANAIVSVVKERNISDIVMGMHHDRTPGGSGIGRMAADLLGYSNVTTFFYHPEQPLTTVKRHLVIVPEKAEKEAGFQLWMQKLRNLAENSSARIVFYAPASTMQYLRPSRGKRSSKAEYVVSDCWNDLTALTYETKRDDCLWVVMSRRDRLSYHPAMSKVPGYMEQFFAGHSFVLVYPVQAGDTDNRYL